MTSREVQRYFLLLLLVTGAAAGLLVGSVALRYSKREERGRLDRFHIQTLLLIQDATVCVQSLQGQFGRRDGLDQGPYVVERPARMDMHALGVALGSIKSLQAEFGEIATGRSADRLQEKFDAVEALLGVAEPDREHLALGTEGLELTLYQFQRMHSVAVSEALFDFIERSRSRDLWILAIATSILLGALATTIGILRLLRNTLARHAELEQESLDGERRLQQGKKMEALGTLVGGVAHDFNNLLTAILGNVELLLADARPGSSTESGLREVLKAGETASGLTRQLLSFSRPEIARPRVVIIEETIDGIEPLLRRLVREDIDLSITHDGGHCAVHMDPVQLEQVIINLVANARDAMPNGGSLTVDDACLDVSPGEGSGLGLPPGHYARLRVVDSGQGMSPEIRERIFEPFFTTKNRGEGTGLGLSTVHGIVTKIDGAIRVDSAPGTGTRVEVFLPTCEAEARSSATIDAPSAQGGKETILLAEDTLAVRKVTARGLARAGYEVLEAEDGAQALQVFREHAGVIRALVTDVVMPNMGGPELAQAVQALQPDIRVVFLSGYSEEMVKGMDRSQEMVMVAKPFTMNELLGVLRQELEAPESAAEALP